MKKRIDNKKMKKTLYITSILIFLIIGFVVSMVFFSKSDDSTSINIGYRKHVAYMPLFVAQDKGFFEEQGLEINTIVFDSTNQMIAAVVSGNIDASITGANLQTVFSVEEKSPNLMMIFQTLDMNEETGISCVMVKSDSEITSLQELKGKKSAAPPGTFSPIWINAALNTVGLSKEDISIQGLSPGLQLSALESDQVDVLFTLEPACSFGVNSGVGKIIYQEPIRHLGSSLTGSVISLDFMVKNPESANKLVYATDKAIDFIRENPEEAMLIMAKHTGYSVESIEGMIMPVYSKSNELNVKSIQDLADRLYVENDLQKQINVSSMIYG
ncbi:MAG: ABC transporter substrate-binding protein [Candidatus Woesearchaeota archaeon]